MCFGLFLAKYGEQILYRANKQKLITRWYSNTKSFPMKLSVTVNAETKCFDNVNKNETLNLNPIAGMIDDIVFLLDNIPRADQDSFDENVDTSFFDNEPVEDVPVKIAETVKAYDAEIDPKKALDVEIILDDTESTAIVFSFLKEEIEDISHGIFLLKYGKLILDSFRRILIDSEKKIPAFVKGPSFPMKLKFYEVFDLGEVFNNDNKEQSLFWMKKTDNIISLMHFEEWESEYFDDCVADPEEITECIFCFGALNEAVFAFESLDGEITAKMPKIQGGCDIMKLPCTHSFHVHCYLKSCIHKFYRCPRCTRKPEILWLVDQFSAVVRNIIAHIHEYRERLISTNNQNMINSGNLQEFYIEIKIKSGETVTPETSKSIDSLWGNIEMLSKRIKETHDQLSIDKKILTVLENEGEFLRNFINRPPAQLIRSQATTPTLHMLQQLNLRLEAALT